MSEEKRLLKSVEDLLAAGKENDNYLRSYEFVLAPHFTPTQVAFEGTSTVFSYDLKLPRKMQGHV